MQPSSSNDSVHVPAEEKKKRHWNCTSTSRSAVRMLAGQQSLKDQGKAGGSREKDFDSVDPKQKLETHNHTALHVALGKHYLSIINCSIVLLQLLSFISF